MSFVLPNHPVSDTYLSQPTYSYPLHVDRLRRLQNRIYEQKVEPRYHKDFPRFTLLPFELRQLVWNYALAPRLIHVSIDLDVDRGSWDVRIECVPVHVLMLRLI